MRAWNRKTPDPTAALALGAALALALVGAFACRPSGQAEETEGAAPAAGAETAQGGSATVGALSARTWLDDFTIGHQVDTEGAIPLARQGDDFAPGQTVYVAMEVGDAPAGASVHVRFEDAAGRTVAEDEKKVPRGAKYLYFDSGDTSSWKPGDYRAEISVGGQGVNGQSFKLSGS